MSARDRQVGGNHYKTEGIQPIDIIDAFGLNFYEGNALKYLLRWRKKNGVEDIDKAIHYLELLKERVTTDGEDNINLSPMQEDDNGGYIQERLF